MSHKALLKSLLYILLTLAPVALIIFFSYSYIDKNLALAVNSLWKTEQIKKSAMLGNFLTACVYLLMIPVFIAYYLFSLEGFEKEKIMRFISQLSLSTAFGYFIKDCLKFFFGRPSTINYATGKLRFIDTPNLFHLHFFSPGNYSFPSGHMTMICAMMVSVILFFPKLKLSAIAAIFTMAILLLLFNFHFLSDIIAGAYLGTTIALAFYYKEASYSKVETY